MNLHLAEGAPFVRDALRRSGAGHDHRAGREVALLHDDDPIGQTIKVGNEWLTVVGVLEDRKVSAETAQRLGIRDANMDVYVPLPTMLLRYRNRAEVTQQEMELAARESNNGSSNDSSETDDARAEKRNYHQLDKIIVQVDKSTRRHRAWPTSCGACCSGGTTTSPISRSPCPNCCCSRSSARRRSSTSCSARSRRSRWSSAASAS